MNLNVDNLQQILANFVFYILLITMVFNWLNFSFFNGNILVVKFIQLNIIISNISLFLILLIRWIFDGYFPLSNLYESLLFLVWILLTLCLYLEFKTNIKLISSVLIPIILLIDGFANLTLSPEMQKSSSLVASLQSNWLMMHVSMMLLSDATLIIGSLICILFLFLSLGKDTNLKFVDTSVSELSLHNTMLNYYELKSISLSNQIASIGKLKLLKSLDNWSYRIIGLGFPFLTVGIISGGVWANEAWGSYWSWDPKETWALVTWLVFAAYLHARITKGWEGKKTAILGSLGFFVIWICYLGVNFLGKGLHSYGWLS